MTGLRLGAFSPVGEDPVGDAGENRGSFWRPEIGDEVVLGFLNSDPRDAIILGMLNMIGTLTFAVLITLGAGLGATGTYVLATTGSLTEASQILRDGSLQLVEKFRTLMSVLSLPASTTLTPVSANATPSNISTIAVTEPRNGSAQQIQEQQARAAAEQRLWLVSQ